MGYRKRKDGNYWWNDGPITDEHEALYVLVEEWNGAKPVYLSTKDDPEICQELHRQGEGGAMSSTRIEYLEIDPKLAEHLIKEHFVTPMRIPHMGYTEVSQTKLVLSRDGVDRLRVLTAEHLALAKTLPVAGEHTKFSSIFKESGSGRENGRRGGPLYFDFVTPMGEKVRVLPLTKEVRKITKEALV